MHEEDLFLVGVLGKANANVGLSAINDLKHGQKGDAHYIHAKTYQIIVPFRSLQLIDLMK